VQEFAEQAPKPAATSRQIISTVAESRASNKLHEVACSGYMC